jgi:type II secretory pathway component GspD/PulD (secretin)
MKRALCLLFLALALAELGAQRIKRMEFRSQPIVDILLSLAQASGRSIVPDETVSGNASFFFSEADFDDALASFLSTYKLYSAKLGATYYVSRVYASYYRERDEVTMKSDEVELQSLVKALSRAIGRTIVYDSLPRGQLSLNIEAVSAEKALEIIMRRFPEYRIEKDSAYFYLKKAPQEASFSSAPGTPKKTEIRKVGDKFSLSLERGKFADTVEQLFAAAGKEYSLLTKSDAPLEDLYFSERDFDALLRLVLEQGNADFAVEGDVYRIFEIQRRDVVKGFRPVTSVQLRYLSAQDLLALMPGDLGSGNAIKVDKDANSLVISGSPEETGPILEFIRTVDRPLEGRTYYRFATKYLKAKDLAAMLPSRLAPVPPTLLPDGNSFVALGSPESAAGIQAYLDMVDKRKEGFPVSLKYIKGEELMKNLPPSVSREDIVESGLPSLVFFVGSDEKREVFLREKAVVDRPKPQIRYELLVIQHQKGSSLDWSRALSAAKPSSGSDSLVASLSELLSLNFDVVSQFGVLFSAQLSLELKDSLARIFADTTLSALSGQEVKFQNTSTYRYAEATYDPDTKRYTYSGATREITSGLILGVNGWVSGDRMITMTVNATISKQGTSSSTDLSVLPPTTEKVVTTQVRTSSGVPISIGGLKQTDTSLTVDKLPILGDLPLLGLLFRNKSETSEETEFEIYIVPRVTYGDEPDALPLGQSMEDCYCSYVKGFVK